MPIFLKAVRSQYKHDPNGFASLNGMWGFTDGVDNQPEDIEEVAGYAQGLRAEYPEAKLSQYVIYCFGNRGFRVCTV